MGERIENKVKAFIDKEIGLLPKAKIVVGLSGGADSVALLHILHRLGYECVAAHCNFHLRGEESDRDEVFAGEFASKLNIPFHIKHFNTTGIAHEQNISIEMAARELRYQWFEELRIEQQAIAIAVAHHQDDSIETMLLNLTRGTGIAGLTGIKARNKYIVRPLLCINRKEAEQYIAERGLSYITDSTNLQDEYLRNKIRHHLIPLLESLNPAARSSLLQTMNNLNEVSKIYHFYINNIKKEVFDPRAGLIDIAALFALPSPEAVLFEILRDYGYNKDDIRAILDAAQSVSGKTFYSKSYRLVKDRQSFILTVRGDEEEEEYLIYQDDLCLSFPLLLEITYMPNSRTVTIRKEQSYAFLDADKLSFPLILRKWKAGDRFVPFGMKGSQKLSDYFNNNKFSIPEKENTWILCSKDKIVWIVGHRIDNRFRITKNTGNICVFRLCK